MAGEIRCDIKKRLGVLSTNERSGWTKEANIISWNEGSDKLDIREWSPDHAKSSKGITLTEQEARQLAIVLRDIFR